MDTVHHLRFVFGTLCILLSGGIAGARAFEHPGGLHSRSQIESVRKKIAAREEPWTAAYRSLLEQADKSLARSPEAIADFNVPGYYSDAEGHRNAARRLSGDAWAAYSCAIAYQLTAGQERTKYADKAVEMLGAWAKTNRKASNADGSLVMAYAGSGLVFSAEMLTDYDGWKGGQREEFKAWVRAVYLRSCRGILGRPNNWGDWGVLGSIAVHHFLDDAAALDADRKHLRERIDKEIAADGSMPHEAGRGKNGMWYTYFALAPLTAACQIALNARGDDIFHYKGKSGAGIEQAMDYLFRYCREPKKWPHYRKEDLSLPKPGGWPGNLCEAMGGIYGRKEYEDWVRDARPITVHGHHYAWAVPTLLGTAPPRRDAPKGEDR